MKKIIIFLSFIFICRPFSIANTRDTCIITPTYFFAVYDSYAALLNMTGDMNSDIFIYDFTHWTRAHLPGMILNVDIFNYHSVGAFYEVKSFYELNDIKPGKFAQSIMHHCLNIKIPTKSNLQQASIGYELLSGEILPQDTILGKALLAMLINECPDDLEKRILPFWRDSISKEIYTHRHDSILQEYGKMWEGPLINPVLKTGNIRAYQELIKNDPDGDLMMLSVYMIDQYKYYPAYEDLYDCIVKVYQRFHKKMGSWAFVWIYTILTDPAAENVPQELLQRIANDAANVKL